MQTPFQYAKSQIEAGKMVSMTIVAGEFGTFWLHDADWKMLDAKAFMSADAAMKFRSKVIDKAMKVAA